MLPIPELLPNDARPPALPSAPGLAPAAPGGEGSVPGFADMLSLAVPEGERPLAGRGERLPGDGNDLPEAIELPMPLDEAAARRQRSQAAVPVSRDAVAEISTAATGEAPLEGAGEWPVDVMPVAAEGRHPSTPENDPDKALAALQAMLPPRRAQPEPVAAAVAAAVPGEAGSAAQPTPVSVPGLRQATRATALAGPPAALPLPAAAAPQPSSVIGPLPVDATTPSADGGDALPPGTTGRELPTGLQTGPQADPLAVATPADARLEAADHLPRQAAPVIITAPTANPAGSERAAGAALPPTLPVDLPVTDQRWGQAIGERVLWMTGQKLQTAEIRMNPVELGPLRVEVKMDDGNAQVTFSAQHALTRDALEQALPRLRELFSSEGLHLANADVTEQGVKQGREERGEGSGTSADVSLAGDDEATREAPLPVRTRDGLVDTFA